MFSFDINQFNRHSPPRCQTRGGCERYKRRTRSGTTIVGGKAKFCTYYRCSECGAEWMEVNHFKDSEDKNG